MFATSRRIKAPQRGLLTLHPLVDVLEGRSLFTATAHDGVLAVESVVVAPPPAATLSPWSARAIRTAESAAAEDPVTAVAGRGTPAVVELRPETTGATFGATTIGDSPWALFGNALHDRRGSFFPRPLPTAEQIEAAGNASTDDLTLALAGGRSITGAMMPFLTMAADHARHPFAA